MGSLITLLLLIAGAVVFVLAALGVITATAKVVCIGFAFVTVALAIERLIVEPVVRRRVT